MKNRIILSLLALATILMSFTAVEARSYVEGYWSNAVEGMQIEIRSTNYGIKVKRTDKSRWFYYDREGNDSFRDHDGNRYFLEGDSRLVWKNRSGRKSLRFRRANTGSSNRGNYGNRYDDYNDNRNGRYGDRYDDRYGDRYNDRYGNRNRNNNYGNRGSTYENRNWNRRFKVKYLEGTWFNNRTGQRLSIVPRNRSSFKINTRKGWTTFRQSNNGNYVDRRGNSIRILNNGRIKYIRCDRRGDQVLVFSRGNRRGRY